jgi:predicted nucleotidyltransferase
MARKIPTKIQHILQETRIELQKIYSGRLKDIILYGSYARGDYSKDSDIDLLLVLEHLNDLAVEREKYVPVVCRISLKYDTVLSVIPYDYLAYQTKKTPLLMNVHKEGVRV